MVDQSLGTAAQDTSSFLGEILWLEVVKHVSAETELRGIAEGAWTTFVKNHIWRFEDHVPIPLDLVSSGTWNRRYWN